MQQPNTLLAILSKMAQKPQVNFDTLYPKLYNVGLWHLAYQSIAPNTGNMTAGVDGKTIDGTGLKLITDTIAQLKATQYRPIPARRVYIPKANGKMRPIGIPAFRDKLLQTVVKLILEAIYEPLFSNNSHGFRPQRSCHTALAHVKRMPGVRWWVEGDIKGFFDNLHHDTLLSILGKRITDKRFLHLIGQFLKAGYVEDWQYHHTYSGTPQGGNLSPILSNIYLNELDQTMTNKIAEFGRGAYRARNRDYSYAKTALSKVKQKARRTGNRKEWEKYKLLRQRALRLDPSDPQDPGFRRLYYVRYADDFLVGVIGSKAEADELKAWLQDYLSNNLKLELSTEKTLITNAKERVRFLGYDIKRWAGAGKHVVRFRTKAGIKTQRIGTYQLSLLALVDKTVAFAKRYGETNKWRGKSRSSLLNLSELEILMTYNTEVRGFLGYYSLADNLSDMARRVMWLTSTSFFRTLANKRKSTLKKVTKSLKKGPNRYVVPLLEKGRVVKEYELFSSTRQLKKGKINYSHVDLLPNTAMYRATTELGKRLLAQRCEWCGTQDGQMEVHHVRKLADL